MGNYQKPMIIREMPEDERPREKLIELGAQSLTKAELIAIIISTGTREKSAIDLGREILFRFGDNLSDFLDMRIEELCRDKSLKGIGVAKACKIKAALELGKRLGDTKPQDETITTPEAAASCLMDALRYKKTEHFAILILDTKRKLINRELISIGTLDASIAHPREIFSPAIRQHGSAIIVGHNHPSGDPTPSREDIAVTRRLVDAGELLGIPVLDHVIVTDQAYISLRQNGDMN
ncbi:MAG: DNA repair protein RadC [Eubacteriaceae bacterium]|jgi:DNA repair protein RadC|nr:DNA repair protein RadC [Eubacteriaceae bacterium]